MGYVLHAICPNCSYESGDLRVGDGLHFICACENCKSVVNPQRVRFHFTIPICPNCKVRLAPSGFVNIGHQLIYARPPVEVEATNRCPRCNDAKLTFKEIKHFIPRLILMPAEGAVVHGQIVESGKLEIPNLSWVDGLHLEVTPLDAQDRPMELKVTRIQKTPPPDDKRSSKIGIFVEFVRYLSQEDLEQAPME